MGQPRKKDHGKGKVAIPPGGCVFCGGEQDNEETYGKFIRSQDLSIHYFCMLFASGLCQNGDDEKQGIMGFLVSDIIKEFRRASRLRCVFCKRLGATIGCVMSRCRMVFHFPCGLDNGVLNLFTGKFCSYCEVHRPRQTVHTSDRLAFHGTAKTTCPICMCSVEARSSNSTLRAPCCKNSWFHKECLQRHASCSGLHFFKCPLCNNREVFQEEMLNFGIYIPDQDAAWEREPNAFQELLQRYNHCDTPTCKCPHGRDYAKNDSRWEMMLCDWCGSSGTHLACDGLRTPMDDWVCRQCKSVTGKGKRKSPKEKSPKGGRKSAERQRLIEEKLALMQGPSPTQKKKGKKRKCPVGSPEPPGKRKRLQGSANPSPSTSTNMSPGPSTYATKPRTSPEDRNNNKLTRKPCGAKGGCGFWTPEELALGVQLRVSLVSMTRPMIRRAQRQLREVRREGKVTKIESSCDEQDDEDLDMRSILLSLQHLNPVNKHEKLRCYNLTQKDLEMRRLLLSLKQLRPKTSKSKPRIGGSRRVIGAESQSKEGTKVSVGEIAAESGDAMKIQACTASSQLFAENAKETPSPQLSAENEKETVLENMSPAKKQKVDNDEVNLIEMENNSDPVSEAPPGEDGFDSVACDNEPPQSQVFNVVDNNKDSDNMKDATPTRASATSAPTPIVVEECDESCDTDDDLIVLSVKVIPKVCTCDKGKEKAKTPTKWRYSQVDPTEDLLMIVSDPEADENGDFIKSGSGGTMDNYSPLQARGLDMSGDGNRGSDLHAERDAELTRKTEPPAQPSTHKTRVEENHHPHMPRSPQRDNDAENQDRTATKTASKTPPLVPCNSSQPACLNPGIVISQTLVTSKPLQAPPSVAPLLSFRFTQPPVQVPRLIPPPPVMYQYLPPPHGRNTPYGPRYLPPPSGYCGPTFYYKETYPLSSIPSNMIRPQHPPHPMFWQP